MDRSLMSRLGGEVVAGEAVSLGTDSFSEFYVRQWQPVVGLGYVLTGNRWVAEELAQEAFLAASGQWDRVSAMENPGGWVRRVVANRAVSWFRRRGAERRALARVGNLGVDRDLGVHAEIAEVWAAVRKLPRRQAQVIALVYFDGMRLGEASELMGCSRETARTHLKRGRRTLAARLGAEVVRDA